eukprot:COSAG04_NODE_8211_length_1006_cov_1.452040_1_plen_153_part_00
MMGWCADGKLGGVVGWGALTREAVGGDMEEGEDAGLLAGDGEALEPGEGVAAGGPRVHDGRAAAPEAVPVGVDPERHERIVHVHVGVDQAGGDEQAGGVEDLGGLVARQVRPDGDDHAVAHGHVRHRVCRARGGGWGEVMGGGGAEEEARQV